MLEKVQFTSFAANKYFHPQRIPLSPKNKEISFKNNEDDSVEFKKACEKGDNPKKAALLAEGHIGLTLFPYITDNKKLNREVGKCLFGLATCFDNTNNPEYDKLTQAFRTRSKEIFDNN